MKTAKTLIKRLKWLRELREIIKEQIKEDPNPELLARELDSLETVIAEYEHVILVSKNA